MDLMTRMIEHHVWLTGEMIDRATRLTDEQLDAPIEVPIGTIDDDMTIRSVLGRLVGQLAQWNAAVDQRSYDWDQERGKSLSTLRRELAEEGPAFLDQVRTTIEEGRLDDTFVDVTCETPRVFTYGGMVAHVLTFAAVRRLVVLGAFENHRHHRPRRRGPDGVDGRPGLTAGRGQVWRSTSTERACSSHRRRPRPPGCRRRRPALVDRTTSPWWTHWLAGQHAARRRRRRR